MRALLSLSSLLVSLILSHQITTSIGRSPPHALKGEPDVWLPTDGHHNHRRGCRATTVCHGSVPITERATLDTTSTNPLLLPRNGYGGSSSSDSPPEIFGKVWPKAPPRTPRTDSGTSLTESSSHSFSSSPGLKLVRHRPKGQGHPPLGYYSPDLQPSKNVPPAHRKQQAKFKARQPSTATKGWRNQRPASLNVPKKEMAPFKHPRELLKGKQPATGGIKGKRPTPLSIPGKPAKQTGKQTLGELMGWGQPKPKTPPSRKPSESTAPFSKLNLHGTPGSPPPPAPRKKGVAHKMATGAKQVTKNAVKGVAKGFKKLFSRDHLGGVEEEEEATEGKREVPQRSKRQVDPDPWLMKRHDPGILKTPVKGGGFYFRHTRPAQRPIFPNGPKFFKESPPTAIGAGRSPARPPSPKLWEHLRLPNPANFGPTPTSHPHPHSHKRTSPPSPAAHPPPAAAEKKKKGKAKEIMSKATNGLKRFGRKLFP